jgi:hypothetical protein
MLPTRVIDVVRSVALGNAVLVSDQDEALEELRSDSSLLTEVASLHHLKPEEIISLMEGRISSMDVQSIVNARKM